MLRVRVAGEPKVDSALTSWLPSGVHAAHDRHTMGDAGMTAHRSLILARAVGRGRSSTVMFASVVRQQLASADELDETTWRARL
jgi:hypothetical protein|eukprot:7384465-Prymnesium_polylepis.1